MANREPDSEVPSHLVQHLCKATLHLWPPRTPNQQENVGGSRLSIPCSAWAGSRSLWPQDSKCQNWDTGALHHPDPSTATQGPRSPIVLVGGALRGPLGWGAFGGPLPLGAFAQPLEHGGEAGTGSGWALLAGGREEDARPRWLLAGLWRGGAAVGDGSFWEAPPCRCGVSVRPGPRMPQRPSARPPRRARPAPAQPVWEERAQPRGGAPARLPRRFGLVRPTRPAKEQRSHPGGEVAGARLNRPT